MSSRSCLASRSECLRQGPFAPRALLRFVATTGSVDPDASTVPDTDADTDAASAVDSGTGCGYPAGPYGLTQGRILPPTLSWQGYVGGAAQASTIRITEYYDCDGSKGINALDIDVGASYCVYCNEEAPQVEQLLDGAWGQAGVRVLTLLLADTAGNPATTQTASAWIQEYSLQKTDVAADPTVTFTVAGLPTNIVVDPRTMAITAVLVGFSPEDPMVLDLATSNAQ